MKRIDYLRNCTEEERLDEGTSEELDHLELVEFSNKVIARFPKYVSGDDNLDDELTTASLVLDRIREDLPSMSNEFWNWASQPMDGVVLFPDNAEFPYTKSDLVALCKGDEQLAFELYACCESGVCPETVIDQDSHESDENQCFGVCHQASMNKEILPGATKAEIGSVMMQEVVGDYDVPEEVPEWSWVEQNASFSHVRNGHDGIWEFALNLSRHFTDIPAKLVPVINNAKKENMAYLFFHQGT